MAKRILVIEDDDAVAELVTMILDEAGYAVDRMVPVEDGLLRIRDARPDLVLLDLTLAGTSGLSLPRTCKADVALASLPIVTVSGSAMTVTEDAPALDGEIRKPFDIDELCRVVHRLVEGGATVSEGAPA